MQDARLTLAAAFLAAACATIAVADPNQQQNNPRPPLGNNPHPVIWGGQPARPVQPAPQLPAGRPLDNPNRNHPQLGVGRSPYFFGGFSPYYSGGYGYDPYYGAYPYPYVYPPFYDSYFPPVYLPADELFGPRAAQRFIGLGDQSRSKPIILPPSDDNEPPEPKKGAQRGTNAQALALARKFISFGDAQFAQQDYSAANDRYRTASRNAPQLADAWFRQAFVLVAMGRYSQAMDMIKRGLRINPNWAKSDFKLKELYGPDQMAKNAHRDLLAEAAEENPNDPDLLFLLGIHLYFDGQPERAQKFFERARQLAGADAEYLSAFAPK